MSITDVFETSKVLVEFLFNYENCMKICFWKQGGRTEFYLFYEIHCQTYQRIGSKSINLSLKKKITRLLDSLSCRLVNILYYQFNLFYRTLILTTQYTPYHPVCPQSHKAIAPKRAPQRPISCLMITSWLISVPSAWVSGCSRALIWAFLRRTAATHEVGRPNLGESVGQRVANSARFFFSQSLFWPWKLRHESRAGTDK